MDPTYDFRAIDARWQEAWDRAGCHHAPRLPRGAKFFNYDSGPFPNGPLHLGHVRTYVFGDITARYQRLRGRCVLYATEWDAFGLPNELEAIRNEVSPPEWTRRWIDHMKGQLQALGISYDWSRVRATSDPRYYRWTQWLFLHLLERGLIEKRRAPLPWCPRCWTALAPMQVERGKCWRCSTTVETRSQETWFVLISRYGRRLFDDLERLEDWSPEIRRLCRAWILEHRLDDGTLPDWPVSRRRAWGTPVPIIECTECGDLPVPDDLLPVLLPEELDWSLGPGALDADDSFVRTRCPRCDRPARRETATLDCFFDDVWCHLACLGGADDRAGFPDEALRAWLPVDRFHSGFDTVLYLHLHRFLGIVLHEAGFLDAPDLIGGHVGHALVLAAGHKMSKHRGNAVSPSRFLRRYGADVVRVGIVRAAGPNKAVHSSPNLFRRVEPFLGAIHRLYDRCRTIDAPSGAESRAAGPSAPSRAVLGLRRDAGQSCSRVAGFIEEYRFNAAVEQLEETFGAIEAFVVSRLDTGRLRRDDRRLLAEVLDNYAIALSPFAPHLAEEIWALRGHTPFVSGTTWPGSEVRGE